MNEYFCNLQTLLTAPTEYRLRGGSRILQGQVSNPSQRGTRDRVPKAPRAWVLARGLCPLPGKFLHFLYQNGELYAFLVICIDTVTFKKGTLIKRVGVRTAWTPPRSIPETLQSAFGNSNLVAQDYPATDICVRL